MATTERFAARVFADTTARGATREALSVNISSMRARVCGEALTIRRAGGGKKNSPWCVESRLVVGTFRPRDRARA